MHTGSGAAKPTAALAQAIQGSIGSQASSTAVLQRNIVMDAGYFLTCSTNKDWVNTCMANQAFLRKCMEQREKLQSLLLNNDEENNGFKESQTETTPLCDEVSAMNEEDFPTLESSSHQTREEQHRPITDDKNDDGWQTVRRKRKHNQAAAGQRESFDKNVPKPPTQTVVLRPVCKHNIEDFSTKELRTAIEKVGINNVDEFTLHRHEKANTIAITTRNSSLVSKFLQITEIPNEQHGPLAVQPYKAISSNEVRGVIYLNSPHDDPATLVNELTCNTHKIVAARALGIKQKTILVTFEGKTVPRHIRYVFEVYKVSEYRPRPLVCYGCHQLGHKSDVCPLKVKRCGSCGHEHGEVEECQATPRCLNCEGPHIATSNECPKRKIPPRSNTRRNNQSKRSATRGGMTSQSLQSMFTQTSPAPMRTLSDNSWANIIRPNQQATDPAGLFYSTTSAPSGNAQQRQPGHQSPTSLLSNITPRMQLDWEARFEALSRRVEQGFANVQTNTSRIEQLESLAFEILTKVNYIGEKFDKYLTAKHPPQ